MQNINTKIKLLSFTCALLSQGCSDSTERVSEYLQSGKSHFEQQDYSKARLEYKNALQIDKKLVDAYYHLALMDEKDQNWNGEFSNLSEVIKLDKNHVAARLKLGQLMLLSGQSDQALEKIDEIFKISKDNPDAFALKGAVLLKQKDTAGAMEMADKALAVKPGHVDAISLKTLIFQAKNDFPSALATVEQALKINPNEISFNLLKLQLDSARQDNAAIEADYQELLKRFPDKLEFNFALAKHYFDQGQKDKSLALLQSLIKSHPKDPKPKLVLADFMINADPAKAEQTLKDFISENKEETNFYFILAKLYLQQKKFDQAEDALTQIVQLAKENKAIIAAKVMLANLAMQKSDLNKASALVKEALVLDPRHFEALLLNARLKLINGLYDDAIADLRSVVQDYSKSDEALVLLAQAYLKKNSPELAEENFRKALSLNPGNLAAVMPVVSRMINSNDLARAEDLLQKALSIKPDDAGAMQALAQVRLLKNDWKGMQQISDQIASKPNGQGFAKYLGGKISQGQGHFQEAIDQYKQALSTTPQLPDALNSMLACYNALNQRPLMLAYLNEFMQKNPGEVYPLVLTSDLFALDKKWEDALALLNKGLEKFPESPVLHEAIARIYLAKNDMPNAIQAYKKGLEKAPDNVQLRLLLAIAYETAKQYDDALASYEAVLEKRPDVDTAINNLVALLLDHFPSKENSARAVKLAQRFENSGQPFFLDTYAWALLKDGKAGQALPLFEKVVALKPDVPVFKYHLGLAHHQLNNNDKAIGILEDALKIGSKGDQFVEKDLTIQLLNELKNSKDSKNG